jgi:hypothetical protein
VEQVHEVVQDRCFADRRGDLEQPEEFGGSALGGDPQEARNGDQQGRQIEQNVKALAGKIDHAPLGERLGCADHPRPTDPGNDDDEDQQTERDVQLDGRQMQIGRFGREVVQVEGTDESDQ